MIGKNVAHYKILDKVGIGGMGVVYRARDTRLEREVALKFLTMDFTGPEELKQRFILEAQSASILDHPNICTIHAIEETEDGRLFIVMAYYAGQTIKDKVHQGPLPWQEVIDLGAQIASGLGAAHERGIIHMDVKPANLLVTPEGTVKILDFGLSRFMSQRDPARPDEPLMGTVAYMSPEQVQCDTTGPESDIWALGVVLYESLTGERPFQGKNDMAVLYSIVHKDVDPPIDKVPEIPLELDKIIRRALVRDRRYRYGNIAELMTDLEPLQQSSHAVTDSLPWISQEDWKRQRFQQRVTGLLAVLAVVLLLALWWQPRDSAADRLGIVFFDFENAAMGAEPGWMEMALSETLVIGLQSAELSDGTSPRWLREGQAETDGTPRLNWNQLDQVFREGQGLTDTHLLDLLRDQSAAWILRGDFEIVGQEGQRLRARLWIQSTEAGSLVESIEAIGDLADPAPIIAELAAGLAQKLSLALPEEPPAIGLPVRDEARNRLSEALKQQRFLKVGEVEKLLLEAHNLEPGNAFILIQLASTQALLGHEEAARQWASLAVTASSGLAPMQQLYVRALRCEVEHKNKKAAAFLRLVRSSSEISEGENSEIDPFDFAIRLGELLAEIGEHKLALEVLAPLAALHPEHPRIILAQGVATESNPESNPNAQKKFAQAADMARQHNAPLLQATALQREGERWQWLKEPTKARDKLEAALDIFSAEKYVTGQAQTMVAQGVLFKAQGELSSAKNLYEQAAALHGSVGGHYLEARALNNLANIFIERGNFGAAIGVYQDILERFRRIGDEVSQGVTLGNLAFAFSKNGNFDEAEKNFKSSLDRLASVGKKTYVAFFQTSYGELLIKQGRLNEARQQLESALDEEDLPEATEAEAISYLGQVLYYQGNLDQALVHYNEARSIFKAENPGSIEYGVVLAWIGQVRIVQGNLPAAQQELEAALEILDASTDPHPAGRTRLILAALLIEEGQPREAEEQARGVLKELGQSEVMLDKASAHIVLARSLLAQKKLEDAQAEIEKARELAGVIESPLFKVPLELTQARILTAGGQTEGVYENLQDLLKAGIGKFVGLELEIRFAQAEAGGGTRNGRNNLNELANDADSKGFVLIALAARRAAAEP